MPTIQQLVAEGRIKEALELLPAGDDQTIMLKGRFSKNEKEKNLGILTYEEHQREHNRIVLALLSLAETVRPSQPPVDSPREEAAPKRPGRKLNVFVSYSHQDEDFKNALDIHLSALKRSDRIAVWSDRSIRAGTEWDAEIKRQLEEADLILLLISAHFMASDYIWKTELTRAMERHDRREAVIVPVFIKSCDWHGAPFGKLQGLPKDAKPIDDPKNDRSWTDVARGIRAVAEGM
ncbi:MAG: toll/interleukin-1 receptor domain-containing protein [Haliscomenobacter sp.]|nr:toll/interleukin-1 receptor domain-containing protein [Haliscomenobacter sp.]